MDFIEAKIYFVFFPTLACTSLWWSPHTHKQTRAHNISISCTQTMCSRPRRYFSTLAVLQSILTQTEYPIFDFILLSTT